MTAINISRQSHVIRHIEGRRQAFLVDHIDGENVTLMRRDYSDSPFWIDTTAAQIVHGVRHEGVEVFAPTHVFFAPRGDCPTCDRQRETESTFFPSHDAMEHCRSGRRNHCSCNSCF